MDGFLVQNVDASLPVDNDASEVTCLPSCNPGDMSEDAEEVCIISNNDNIDMQY